MPAKKNKLVAPLDKELKEASSAPALAQLEDVTNRLIERAIKDLKPKPRAKKAVSAPILEPVKESSPKPVKESVAPPPAPKAKRASRKKA